MPNERIVGLVRPVARLPENKQRAHLEPQCVKVWGYDQFDLFLRYIRQGNLVAVCAPHVLGESRSAIEANMAAIFDRKCSICVDYPGAEPLEAHHSGKAAVQMALRAVAGLSGDSRAPTSEEAAKRGKMAWKKRTRDRTTYAVARKFWKSKRGQSMTVKERMKQPEMRGWSDKTFYRQLKEDREN